MNLYASLWNCSVLLLINRLHVGNLKTKATLETSMKKEKCNTIKSLKPICYPFKYQQTVLFLQTHSS